MCLICHKACNKDYCTLQKQIQESLIRTRPACKDDGFSGKCSEEERRREGKEILSDQFPFCSVRRWCGAHSSVRPSDESDLRATLKSRWLSYRRWQRRRRRRPLLIVLPLPSLFTPHHCVLELYLEWLRNKRESKPCL